MRWSHLPSEPQIGKVGVLRLVVEVGRVKSRIADSSFVQRSQFAVSWELVLSENRFTDQSSVGIASSVWIRSVGPPELEILLTVATPPEGKTQRNWTWLMHHRALAS